MNSSDSQNTDSLSTDSPSTDSLSTDSQTTQFNQIKKNIDDEKQKMINNMSKEEMVDLIFKQHILLRQQSTQLVELVDLANKIQANIKSEESKKQLINNKASNVQKQQISVYENSMKIQLMLFILIVIIMIWLFYHYTTIPRIFGIEMPNK